MNIKNIISFLLVIMPIATLFGQSDASKLDNLKSNKLSNSIIKHGIAPKDSIVVSFSNMEDLIKVVPTKINFLLKEIELNSNDLVKVKSLRESIWRFENAVLLSENIVSNAMNNKIEDRLNGIVPNNSSLKPMDGKPYEFNSEEEMDKMVPMYIKRCMNNIELNKNQSEYIQYYREMLWRYENAMVTKSELK